MADLSELMSSPPPGGGEDSLAWYKSQYEQLEQELSEFQASSKELEAELERDLDAADKRERALQEKAESLSFEVEEWKRKYKESKTEANAAQSTLEKEITTLRDTNRTLQLKLRDIEVANDDFERQARNTTSSLEDLESKYNVAIERAVMMEEEIKLGEQEREQLRVEVQRLREELSDLKIEAEILQDKIKKQESRHLSAISTDVSIPESPTFEHSPNSTASSPLITTPPDTTSLTAETVSEIQDPPSPPMSDVSASIRKLTEVKTPAPSMQKRSRLPSADNSITPKPKLFNTSLSRATGARAAATGGATRTPASRTTASKPTRTATNNNRKLPTSTSLTHVRTLTAQMQRLEARVQSARSKLPAPVITPPRASPRSSINVPSSVTIRSRKRTIGSASVVSSAAEDATHSNAVNPDLRRSVNAASKHLPRLSTTSVSRLSFGPGPNRNPGANEMNGSAVDSRPSSRASVSSYARPGSRAESHVGGMIPPPRPVSRTSFGGARTPQVGGSRPRSSLAGSMNGSLHGHSQSTSTNSFYGTVEVDEDVPPLPTPSRRGTYSRLEVEAGASGIPAPTSSIPIPSSFRRQSGGGEGLVAGSRRASSVAGNRLADLGETY